MTDDNKAKVISFVSNHITFPIIVQRYTLNCSNAKRKFTERESKKYVSKRCEKGKNSQESTVYTCSLFVISKVWHLYFLNMLKKTLELSLIKCYLYETERKRLK